MTPNYRWPYIVGALLSIILQAVIAPNVHILDAMPNFILCYVIVVAVVNARGAGYIMPFLLGLAYDLMGSGPIGAMALVCVGVTFVASYAFIAFDNETTFVPIVILVLVCFFAELVYGLLLVACGLNVGFLEAVLNVCLPCGLYDTVLSLVAFPLVRRFVFGTKRQSEMTIIDTGIE